MRNLFRASPEERTQLVQQYPRLGAVDMALEGDTIERERELEQKRQELALQTQQQRENKLFETYLGRGENIGPDGNITRLFDPNDQEINKARALADIDVNKSNRIARGAQNIVRLEPTIKPLENVPPPLRDEAYKELLTTGNREQAVNEIDVLYEKAASLNPVESRIPFTTANKEKVAINNALAGLYQKALAREMNGPDRLLLNSSLITATDGPEQIRMKKEILKSSVLKPASPILDQFSGSSAPKSVNIETKVLRDGTQVKVQRMDDGSYVEVQ